MNYWNGVLYFELNGEVWEIEFHPSLSYYDLVGIEQAITAENLYLT